MPWSHSHNDDPRNGMALCGLHHWSFDHGLVTVTAGYTVAISPDVPPDERAAPLRALGGQPIQRPADPRLQPARDALRWHARHVFRSGG